MRVLLSAYACEPGKGSEDGIGWNWVCQAARFHEVWAITRANNRAAIEASFDGPRMPNVHWVYFDLPRWARFWKKRGHGIRFYYYLWQLGAYFVARRLHCNVGFNLGHHVTFGNYWMPSFFALLPVPFVWGPVGGGESGPRAFRGCFSFRGRLYEMLRDLARNRARLDPLVRLTARRAALGIATSEETAARLRGLGCRKIIVLSQVALPQEEILRLGGFTLGQKKTFRLISIGNLLHWKGFELGLRAFALFKRSCILSEYWIVGDGPERRRLEKLARRLDVAESVNFWGAIPRLQLLDKLAECDVLLHPSLHDSGGWVCLEGMAAGSTVVCLDLGGPALLVTEDTGIKVAAISPEQVVRDLAGAFYKLESDPGLGARLGKAGRQRVKEHFTWDKKGDLLREIYESIAAMPEALSPAALELVGETRDR